MRKEHKYEIRRRNSGLFKPAKSLIGVVVVLGLFSGVFLRWLYEDRPWINAVETYTTEGSTVTDPTQGTAVVTPLPTSSVGLTVNQILQRITDAASGNLSTNEAFLAIPTAQLGGLTFEEFQRYISLIDAAIDVVPSSFSPMTTSERDRQIARIVQIDPEYRGIAENSSYHWIEGMGNDRQVQSVAIALQTNSNGMVYIDKSWVKHIIDLYDYAQTYLGTIQQENAEILSKMVHSISTTSEVKLAKAQSVINYYSIFNIKSQGLKLESFDIAHLRYTVTTEFNPDNPDESDISGTVPFGAELPNRSQLSEAIDEGRLESQMTRTLILQQNMAGAYRIIDPIPEMTFEDDFAVTMHEGLRLTLDSEVTIDEMNQLFGKPLIVTDYEAVSHGLTVDSSERSSVITPTPIEDELAEDADLRFLFVRYEGVELVLRAYSQPEEGQLRGTLVGITFTKPLLSTLRGLGSLMVLDDLLLSYNFIDQMDFVLKNQNLGYYIAFPALNQDSSAEERIGAIRLGRIEDLAYDLYDNTEIFGTGDDLSSFVETEEVDVLDESGGEAFNGLATTLRSFTYER